MNQKTKKKLNYSILGYIIAVIFTAFIGAILGLKISMLKVHATAFPNSTITYNEGQVLYNNNTTENRYISINQLNDVYTITFTYYTNSGYVKLLYNRVYTNCTYNSGIITCSNSYTINYNATANATVSNTSTTFTVNSDSITFSNNTYTILSSGYTQADLDQAYANGVAHVQAYPNDYGLYTLAQYNANYTAGQNSVINNPNTYNLYTSTQYNNYGTTQYNSGYSAGSTAKENDILTNPNTYGLYSSAQYTAYGSSQYTAGQNSVINSPNTYNLYTTAQYNSYGTSQYNSGLLAGQNDVINNPHNYNLYTSTEYTNNYIAGQSDVINNPHSYDLYTASEYSSYGTSQYNVGYLAGLSDNEAYQLGIQHVLNNPHDYDLYTESEYNNYGTNKYNAGIQYVLDNWEEYNLYNQTQYNTYGQQQYNAGYNEGINSYQAQETIIPTFNILNQNLLYGCVNGNNYHSACQGTNVPGNDVEINTLKLSTYAPYTNVLFNIDNMTGNYGYNIDTYNYYVVFSKSYSSNGTIGIPDSVSDVYIKFCNSYSEYYVLSERYTYCNSIATNVENYTPSGQWIGVNSIYDNPGIYVGNITDVEDNYKIIDLSNYLVGSYTNYSYIEITLGNANDIQTQYNNFEIKYISSSLDSESYNLGYENGFGKGNAIGQATAQQSEYNRGYNTGYRAATKVGDNSIRGLAETILTSPVNMFKTMFNVQFLDINLAGFILSIFTIIVVIWLIKKIW